MRAGILWGSLIVGARGQAGAGKPYVMEVPQVMLPATVTGERKIGPDFLLYYFMQGDRQILFAYVGGFPQFPKGIPAPVKPTASTINGMPTTTYTWKDDKGRRCRETLCVHREP